MSDQRKFHPWSWCRDLLSQGGDIYHDRMPGGYEVYSARLDAAARERADELKAHCVPRDVADHLAEALEAIAGDARLSGELTKHIRGMVDLYRTVTLS